MKEWKPVIPDAVMTEFVGRLGDCLIQAKNSGRFQVARLAVKLKNEILIDKLGCCETVSKEIIYSALALTH